MPAQNKQERQDQPNRQISQPNDQPPDRQNPGPTGVDADTRAGQSDTLRPLRVASQDNGPRAEPDEALGADPMNMDDLVDPDRDAPNLDALQDAIDDSALDDIDLDPLQSPADTNVIDAIGNYEPDDLDEVEPDAAFFAPVDPVLTVGASGDSEVLGGFSPTSLDGETVDRSAEDNIPGDEALADAVRAALRADAATTDLNVRVQVARGVARLRGRVASLEDAENAEAVASDVPGVNDVIEEIDVDGM